MPAHNGAFANAVNKQKRKERTLTDRRCVYAHQMKIYLSSLRLRASAYPLPALWSALLMFERCAFHGW